MTFSLALSTTGDLLVNGSECAIVYGQSKLQQDMQIWLLTTYGSNRNHPQFGCVLQNFIGGVVGSSTQANVYNEVLRVLTNYQALVYQLFAANPALFSLSELPYSIDAINVAVAYDQVNVGVQVSNPASTANVTVSTSSL
jgi:hypothetical protein